mmetsp:Transcript_26051/g.39431  ORF Transcript_26051/g.39431 Transcript_26051/m.39431 type:complete len:112 (+) Transcript_26051:29-364(+)
MTASSSASKAPRHVVRSILQRLRNKVELVQGGDTSAPVRQFVLEKSRTAAAAQWTEFGQHYNQLLGDLQERKRLFKLDTSAENQLSPKEMSRRAAARAGLQLPKLDPDLEK